jgi:hypothetical protein
MKNEIGVDGGAGGAGNDQTSLIRDRWSPIVAAEQNNLVRTQPE